MRPIHHARSTRKTSNHTDSCPTLRLRVHAIYLAAPLHAQAGTEVQTRLSLRLQSDLIGALHGHAMAVLARAGTEVQTRLSLRLQSDLIGALHGHAMAVLARAARRPGQAGSPFH